MKKTLHFKRLLFATLICLIAINLSAQIQKNEYKVQKVEPGAIVADGNIADAAWAKAKWENIDTLTSGTARPTKDDLSARFKALWDKDNFYIVVEVTDSKLDVDLSDVPVGNGYWRDGIEFNWDVTLSNWASGWYPSNGPINQRRIVAGQEKIRNFWGMGVLNDDYGFDQQITMVYKQTATGYLYEIKWPWKDIAYGFDNPATTVSQAVKLGGIIGFNVCINDADGVDLAGQPTPAVDHREHQLGWDGTTGDVYRFASQWGKLVLSEGGTTSAEKINDLETNIYPNPVKDILQISHKGDQLSVSIYDITGRLMFEKSNVSKSINLESLKSGVYLLKLSSNNGSNVIRRIIKE